MIVKETKQKKMSTRTRIVIWVALILLFFYLIWDVRIGTVGESWTWNTLWESNLFRIICVCFVVYGIYYFFFKKKKAKDQTAKKTDPDHHTEPEVEKHTNDDHAHHGDPLYTTASVWVVKLFIFAVVVTVSYFGIKYIFFNNYVTAYPGHESKRIRLVEKNLLGIQKSYYVKIVLDENQRVQVKCYNTGNDGTNIATYSQEIVYGHEYPPFPSALYYTVRSTNGKTFKVDYTRTEVVKP